jgi:hypothetical protein
MQSLKTWKKAVVFLVAVAMVVFVGWWAAHRGSRHPEFGKIYRSEMSESYQDTQTKWQKAAATVRQWLHLPRRPDPSKFGLPVGPALLGWSIHRNSPPLRDGWIYFRDVAPWKPGGNPALWEIALSGKRRLADVSGGDLLNCDFYGQGDPRGSNTFGTNWDGRAIIVPEGQILFARLVTNRPVIYVIHLAKQGGPPSEGSMEIEYVVATNR